ncbi:MAG: sel1 repeat family protein [Proteobacteria bacterium]|nr:sel1 repeat family protein [Pseudomonadota bacterium]
MGKVTSAVIFFLFSMEGIADPRRSVIEDSCAGLDVKGCFKLVQAERKRLQGNVPKSLSVYQDACRRGVAIGCVWWARAVSLGETPESSTPEGIVGLAQLNELTQQCEEQKQGEACLALGEVYFRGNGAPKTFQKSNQYYSLACELKTATGCSNLGLSYQEGEGVEKSFAEANRLYKKACDWGEGRGCAWLGANYELGEFEDYKENPYRFSAANKLYKKACELGEGSGCAWLAANYEKGNGVEPSPEFAKTLFAKACDLGARQACIEPHKIREEEEKKELSVSKAGDVTSKYMETEKIQKKGKNKTELAQKPVREQAVSTQITCEAIATKDCENLANELCQKNDGDACNKLGVHFRDLKDDLEQAQNSKLKAIELFSRACDLGAASGCVNLANCYQQGIGVSADLTSSNKLFAKACEKGDRESCHKMGVNHELGIELEKSVMKASNFYEKACRLGMKSDCQFEEVFAFRKKFAEAHKNCEAIDPSSCIDLSRKVRQKIPGRMPRAVGVYKDACTHGDFESCIWLAYAALKKDYKTDKAPEEFVTESQVKSLKGICEQRNREACLATGIAYDRGLGVVRSFSIANEFFEKACEMGEAIGCGELGNNYFSGLGGLKSDMKGNEFSTKACEWGNGLGCLNLGYSYEKGRGLEKSESKSRDYFSSACALGEGMGCFELGVEFEALNKDDKNSRKENLLFGLGCEFNEEKACSKLGDNIKTGMGIEKSLRRAKYVFEKACELGSQDGCQSARRLKSQMYTDFRSYFQIASWQSLLVAPLPSSGLIKIFYDLIGPDSVL